MIDRPLPPPHLHEPGFQIEPAPEVAEWLMRMFVLEGAPHENPDHAYLAKVDLVGMWTNVEFIDGEMPVIGMAEIVNVTGKPWARAERVEHLCLMHGKIPQARVWLYAPEWVRSDFWTSCAVGQHELYHFAHKKNKEGEPMFDDEDRPMLAKRAHHVGEFIPVVELYGPGACGENVVKLVEAALRPPRLAPAEYRFTGSGACACGARLS